MDLARRSEVAVIVVRDYNSEGSDRMNLLLPQDQNRLIEEVLKVNPRTVLVLETGSPVLMPWIKRVPGGMQAWYAGQQQGNVVADVIFGDVNPSGKLPVSFPRAEREHPIASTDQYPSVPAEIYPGSGNLPQALYLEGLGVGYRGHEQRGIDALYPFGHGLSYTSFDYSKVRVTTLEDDDATTAATTATDGTATGSSASTTAAPKVASNACACGSA